MERVSEMEQASKVWMLQRALEKVQNAFRMTTLCREQGQKGTGGEISPMQMCGLR